MKTTQTEKPGQEIYLFNSLSEQQTGFPQAKAVLAKASEADLRATRLIYLKASFGRNIFAGNAKPLLALCDAEIAARDERNKSINLAAPNQQKRGFILRPSTLYPTA